MLLNYNKLIHFVINLFPLHFQGDNSQVHFSVTTLGIQFPIYYYGCHGFIQGGHSNFRKKLWSILGVFKENNFNFKKYFPIFGKQ